MLRRLVIGLGLGALAVCTSAGGAWAEAVTVASKAPFTQASRATSAVREQCGLESLVPTLVAEASPEASVAAGALPSRGRTLSLSITDVQAPGGGMFSGPKWLEISGTLREGGRDVASFRAKRVTSGGPFGGGGTCGMLQKCARAIAKDVAVWLSDPKPGAELGDAR